MKVPGIDLIIRYPIMIFLEGIEIAAVYHDTRGSKGHKCKVLKVSFCAAVEMMYEGFLKRKHMLKVTSM